MEVIHAVGKISRPMDFYPIALPRQYDPQAPSRRPCRPRAGSGRRSHRVQRLRELPPAAAQQDEEATPEELPPAAAQQDEEATPEELPSAAAQRPKSTPQKKNCPRHSP